MSLQQLVLNISPDHEPSLANYITGKNAEALYAAQVLTKGRALYLWGPKGSGKSHILRSLTRNKKTKYLNSTNCDEILNLAINNEMDFPTTIAMDDVHLLNNEQQSGLFSLYNRWRELSNTKKAFALILSGNNPPMLMNLREDLRTRLGWDLSFRLEPLSDHDKLNALKLLANNLGASNIDNVIEWMLKYHDRDITSLTNLLVSLDKYSIANKRPITIRLLRTMLKESD
ncbi:DnaA regulatory inactivator Hda [Candidatus Kinetoplastibacterium desouzaii TCC079E]|uniref:DnaA regulatory inactivator Hda n=1 Tax=Candidatus Kinetoplastidibacterium desouzai TCC079E TaxID=1208919 RepID=M1L2X9_9PROT|nr:DnaA regulatory inactivator Hda [Candidatus Kinetoplastibacterium desouzaii]AGF47108.1 DnaA regulatory inactivator Hda [Candidatus Kinetoplastibacterium desouzaii TCC079E]